MSNIAGVEVIDIARKMNTFDKCVDDRYKVFAHRRAQNGAIVPYTCNYARRFVRADEIGLNQIELIHCLALEFHRCGLTVRRDRDRR